MRRPEIRIERLDQPTILALSDAVAWIKKVRPILWLGSIFSVPEPAGLPSGWALTRSLLDLTFAGVNLGDGKDRLLNNLATNWPLEALLDEFEFVDLDLSASLLGFFKELNDARDPSVLHKAAVLYYQSGLSRLPLCVTTNWDSLLEKAFRQQDFGVVIAGPAKIPGTEFKRPLSPEIKSICIYHPHGSFETGDVVCSFKQEQRQLTLDPTFLYQPTLFLGYSGYEPSLYMSLEHSSGQLWCVRNREDLEIPAKRRLLCRPNTFVFIGDMRDLLTDLGVLKNDVDLTSKHVAAEDFNVPEARVRVIQIGVISSLDPVICANNLVHSMISFLGEPESTARYVVLMRALVNHVRNRASHPALLAGLLASAQFHNSEHLWITALAFLLRQSKSVSPGAIEGLIALADSAPKPKRKEHSFEDLAVYGFGSVKQRANLYRSYVGKGPKVEDLVYIMSGLYSDHFGALGELIELLAFECLREGKLESASSYFDYAATCFYLRGLSNAGKSNEWAARNVKAMEMAARDNTLIIPMPE
ncbi:MAG: SIR2 family protein [Acidobacteria bacterium]|nr:SIR2 family protein [Acidobacteriota bacterium]